MSDAMPDVVLEANRLSNDAFALAKAIVTGEEELEELQRRAGELQERIPLLSSAADSLPDAQRADVKRALADASLDVRYVLAGGNVPSSVRLHHFAAGR